MQILSPFPDGNNRRKAVGTLRGQPHKTQRSFLEGVPSEMIGHGLQSMAPRPLVSMGKDLHGIYAPVIRVEEPSTAWIFPEVGYPRDDYRYSTLTLDIDGPGSADRIQDIIQSGKLPPYSFMAENPRSGGCHVSWCLKTPVGRPLTHGKPVLPKPLRLFRRCSEFYGVTLRADRSYGAVLAHNPVHEVYTSYWDRKRPYGLTELAEPVPFRWRIPRKPVTEAGRNCAVFLHGMRWAGSPTNKGEPVIFELVRYARENGFLDEGWEHQFTMREIVHTSKSIERYRSQWESRGQFDRRGDMERTLWGRRRGIISGKARRKRTAERDLAIMKDRLRGMSQRGLAEKYGISRTAIRHILNRGGL